VGIFVLVGFFSVLLALFLLTDPSTFRGRYVVTTLVEDAGGVRRGDPVQMRGVNIGRVMSFTMAPDGVILGLEIEGEWRFPVDSRTRLASSGLLGGRTVEVVEGTSQELLPQGGQMRGEKEEGLLDFPPGLGQDAEAALERIQDLLAQPTVDAIAASAQELQGLLSQLSELAEAQGEEIATLTASLNRSAQDIESATGAGEDVARAVARADSALAKVNETSDVLMRASSSLELILARMEGGEGTLGQLSTNASLYENLNAAAESILALATDIKENPGRYVKVEIF
jgi:phospholipid/cholesterol/gamma-HCH transport system substrate-binding protein